MNRNPEPPTSQGRLRRIEGRHNPLVMGLRQAFGPAARSEDGHCAIEGLHVVEEAIRSGLRFRAVFFRESAQALTTRLMPQIAAHVETLLLPDKIFDGAAPSDTPQGVAALVKLKEFSLDDLLERLQVGPVIAVSGLQDPGNLGTILRSAEAFGSAGAILGEGTVSLFNSKVIRGSAGSVFRLPVIVAKKVARIGEHLREVPGTGGALDRDFFAQGDAAGSDEAHRGVGNFCGKRGRRAVARGHGPNG